MSEITHRVLVLSGDGKTFESRPEKKSERIDRERREAIQAQKREVERLDDWLLRLYFKEIEHREAIERNTKDLATTLEKTAKAKQDFQDAQQKLERMERTAI